MTMTQLNREGNAISHETRVAPRLRRMGGDLGATERRSVTIKRFVSKIIKFASLKLFPKITSKAPRNLSLVKNEDRARLLPELFADYFGARKEPKKRKSLTRGKIAEETSEEKKPRVKDDG